MAVQAAATDNSRPNASLTFALFHRSPIWKGHWFLGIPMEEDMPPSPWTTVRSWHSGSAAFGCTMHGSADLEVNVRHGVFCRSGQCHFVGGQDPIMGATVRWAETLNCCTTVTAGQELVSVFANSFAAWTPHSTGRPQRAAPCEGLFGRQEPQNQRWVLCDRARHGFRWASWFENDI